MRHVGQARKESIPERAVGARYGLCSKLLKAHQSGIDAALAFLCARCRGAFRRLLRSLIQMHKACLDSFAREGTDRKDKQEECVVDLTCHETMEEVAGVLMKKEGQVDVASISLYIPEASDTTWYTVNVFSFGKFQSVDAEKWKVFGVCDAPARGKRCKLSPSVFFGYAREAITNLQHIMAAPDTSRMFNGWEEDYVKDNGRFYPGLRDWFWGDYISEDEFPNGLWGWEWDRKSVRRFTMECDVEYIYWMDLSISLVSRAINLGWVAEKSPHDLELGGMTLGLAAAQIAYKYMFHNRISWNYLMRKGFSGYGSKGYTDYQYKRKLKSEEISLLKFLDWKVDGFCIFDTFANIIRENTATYEIDEDPTNFFMELSKLPQESLKKNAMANILQSEHFRMIWFRCITSSRSIRSNNVFSSWQEFVGKLIAKMYCEDTDFSKLEPTMINALLNFDRLCDLSSTENPEENSKDCKKVSFVEECLKMKLD